MLKQQNSSLINDKQSQEALNDSDIEHFWQSCVRDYPVLQQVVLNQAPKDDEIWKFSPGCFTAPKVVGDKPALTMGHLDSEVWAHMNRTREHSLRLTAARIGIPFESLTPKLLHVFIFFHELGHALDFLTKFAHSSGSSASLFRGGKAWRKESGRESAMLPIPGVNPGLLEVYIADGTLRKMFSEHRIIRERFKKLEIHSIDDPHSIETLRAVVNRSYKSGLLEINADDFAASAIHRYAKDLLPIRNHTLNKTLQNKVRQKVRKSLQA